MRKKEMEESSRDQEIEDKREGETREESQGKEPKEENSSEEIGKGTERNGFSGLSEEIDPKNVNLVDLIDRPAWKTILIDLVKSEKMDPWNIDLAALADKYLKKIQSLKGHDLRIPANAILASAILLKFKSRVLKISSLEEDEDEAQKKELSPEEIAQIDSQLPDLGGARKEREGKISLEELVSSIEQMLEKSKERVDKRFLFDRSLPDFRIPFAGSNIEELVDGVLEEIQKKADSNGLVLFSSLVEGKNPSQIVDTFMPCLFLANKGKINMWQDEFFGEIMISIMKQ